MRPGRRRCADDVDDTFTCFSNFGADIDIAAPGGVHSGVHPGLGGLVTEEANSHGTSMATPHVTGAVALYIDKGPGPNTPDGVRTWLFAQGSRPQDDPTYGFTGDPDTFHEPVLYLRFDVAGHP